MAAQQIQVKLFAYSVVERKDEIEEVSRPTLLRQRPSTTTALAPYPHALPFNAASCACVYDPHVVVVDNYASCARAVCVDRPGRSRRRPRRRVFILFCPLEIRTVLSNTPGPDGRPQRPRVSRCSYQPHQQGQEPRGSHQLGAADRRAARSQKHRQGIAAFDYLPTCIQPSLCDRAHASSVRFVLQASYLFTCC